MLGILSRVCSSCCAWSLGFSSSRAQPPSPSYPQHFVSIAALEGLTYPLKSCCLVNLTFGKLPHGKLSLGKLSLGKGLWEIYLAPYKPNIS